MSRLNRLEKAARLLTVAASYAEDGAPQTAIDRATEAIKVLEREKKRRAKLMQQYGGGPKVAQ